MKSSEKVTILFLLFISPTPTPEAHEWLWRGSSVKNKEEEAADEEACINNYLILYFYNR